ncbi:MAG: hypothetical protein V1745_01225, partial [Patescibacteria group bacterium]
YVHRPSQLSRGRAQYLSWTLCGFWMYIHTMKNTKFCGGVTLFIYPVKSRYIGVCLELDLIDEDTDRDILAERMKRRVQSYIAYIQKKEYHDTLLNRPAPKKYWDKFYQFLTIMREEEKWSRDVTSTGESRRPSKANDFVVSRESIVCEPA